MGRRLAVAGVAVTMLVCAGSAQAGSWTLQTMPTPTRPGGSFAAVTCPASSRCIAVGTMIGSTGAGLPLIESGNGTAWSQSSAPHPAGAIHTALDGVSCTTGTACSAVGESVNGSGVASPVAARWDGTSWQLQAPATPASAATQLTLTGVSCPAATECLAVGWYASSTGADVAFAEQWNGTSWQLTGPPDPGGSASTELSAVTCTSATACTAVGFDRPASGGPAPLAERWNGTSWSSEPVPTSAGANGGTLDGISCSSASACTAVGSLGPTSNPEPPLVERWNGTKWTEQTAPAPSGNPYNAVLQAISCSSATACSATGTYNEGSAFAERWNGTSWQITPLAAPTATMALTGIVCTAASACTAVGDVGSPAAGITTLAEHWNGATWQRLTTVDPPGSVGGELAGVACPTSSLCVAVGRTDATPGRPLTETWRGSAWQLTGTPELAGVDSAELDSVSCVTSAECVAVGDERLGSASRPLIEIWDGTSWHVQDVQAPPSGTSRVLDGVSCRRKHWCMAVGWQFDGSTFSGIAEYWAATKWIILPLPGGVGKLSSVTCPTVPWDCTAVGSGVVYWNGFHWTAEPVTPPSGSLGFSLLSVSCDSPPTGCTAAGSNTVSPDGDAQPLVMRPGNAAIWSPEKVPLPSQYQFSVLRGLSCRNAALCIAVGVLPPGNLGHGPKPPDRVFVVANTPGMGWQLSPVPNLNDNADALSGIDCYLGDQGFHDGTCMAVGSGTLDLQVPLAERFLQTAPPATG